MPKADRWAFPTVATPPRLLNSLGHVPWIPPTSPRVTGRGSANDSPRMTVLWNASVTNPRVPTLGFLAAGGKAVRNSMPGDPSDPSASERTGAGIGSAIQRPAISGSPLVVRKCYVYIYDRLNAGLQTWLIITVALCPSATVRPCVHRYWGVGWGENISHN